MVRRHQTGQTAVPSSIEIGRFPQDSSKDAKGANVFCAVVSKIGDTSPFSLWPLREVPPWVENRAASPFLPPDNNGKSNDNGKSEDTAARLSSPKSEGSLPVRAAPHITLTPALSLGGRGRC